MVSPDWLIEVDARRCIGSGLCAAGAPDHFTVTDNVAVPVNTAVEADEAVLDAAECCPMEAIMIRHAADGRVIAPAP
ncbi:ferredoxin [Allocatelliglobosispora scoriae]|uniref:Ferredoxin n=1 Tax=Allocatelliglobosispora scoriae TaxID=643052 RepID=A0A841BLY2_9ACTN|nr:ferredoxin [Allocatelliglobosispora scoriae]MBB5867871.1 ferredoxin [Allocatelliglobosispora scoriae]